MKRLLILLITLLLFSCSKKEFVISIEQPNEQELDNLKLEILLDKKKLKIINLKVTSIASSYETINVPIFEDSKHLLQVKLKDTVVNYTINYPEEKYIIVSTYLKKNSKIQVSILKQKEKFIFH